VRGQKLEKFLSNHKAQFISWQIYAPLGVFLLIVVFDLSIACHFNELSRGSVLCLLNASFEKLFHNTMFYAKIDDHGVRWGDMG
jgi:hypothetical protein